MDFIEAERRYIEFKHKYDAGTLNAADFDVALRELMVQDDQGRWWAKSRDTGDWNYYDSATSAWIVAKPPVELPAAPVNLPPAHGAAPAAAAPERRAKHKERPPAAESQEPVTDFMPPAQLGATAASAKPGLDEFVAPAQGAPLIQPAAEPASFMPPVQLGATAASAKPGLDEFVAPAQGAPLIQPAAEPASFMPPVQFGSTVASAKPAADDFVAPAQGKPLIQSAAASSESFMPPAQIEQAVLPAEPVRPVTARPPTMVGPTPIGAGLSLLIYAASFLIPVVGIVVFFLFRTRPADSDRRLARVALILGLISILLGCLCSGGLILLGGGGGSN